MGGRYAANLMLKWCVSYPLLQTRRARLHFHSMRQVRQANNRAARFVPG